VCRIMGSRYVYQKWVDASRIADETVRRFWHCRSLRGSRR